MGLLTAAAGVDLEITSGDDDDVIASIAVGCSCKIRIL
jgi:hypothetical protein